MIDDDDLDAAAAESIITPAQAEALRAFVISRRHAAERADDERFQFMRGFNDFFFAIGVILFAIGMSYFAGAGLIENLIAAAVIWLLAEFLVGHMRLVLPGILLASLFSYFIYLSIQPDWEWVAHLIGLPYNPTLQSHGIPRGIFDVFRLTFNSTAQPLPVAGRTLGAAFAALVFYLRFRLPFSLLLLAGSVVLFVLVILDSVLSPSVTTLSVILLGCGLSVFAAAMAYDLVDRMRLTRLSDCAFWLHLLAAPLLVHSLIGLILTSRATGMAPSIRLTMTSSSAATIFVIVAILAVVGILIDRRALLVSALTYLGIAIGSTLANSIYTNTPAGQPVVFFATILILGAMMLALGSGWQPLRQLFLRLLPSGLVGRLPPAAGRA